MLSEGHLRELRAFHRSLGDVTRMRVVQFLATENERTVSDIGAHLHISQPLLSWHLHRLKRSGVVTTERHGREVFCILDRERFAELQERTFRLLMNRTAAIR
ncbi:MAG: helix-turn-helix transcriptional regulator [Chloroflexi bacterium]|nr:helix-turn-helix transcriptional regulator [Chloroflexota bacterium]